MCFPLLLGAVVRAGQPAVLEADRTAVRPGEVVSLTLTLVTASPVTIIGAQDQENGRWSVVRAEGGTEPLTASPFGGGLPYIAVPAGAMGVFSRFYTPPDWGGGGAFAPRALPVTITARNAFGDSAPVEIFLGPQPDPANGPGAWINRTSAAYTIRRTTRDYEATRDGDGNTEVLVDETVTSTATLPPGGTFTITNSRFDAEDDSYTVQHEESVTLELAPGQWFGPASL
eukprot:gene10527-14142_t